MKRNDVMEISVGLFFVILGLAMFFYARSHYDLGELGQMGPGFFPSILGIIMAILGGIISVSGIGVPTKARDLSLRPTVLITFSVIAFALMIETLGGLIAIFALVYISSFAENKLSWLKKLILFVVLFVIALVIFKIALGMNFRIIDGVF